MNDYLIHYGIKSMKWGIRRFQNEDGTLTPAGKARYGRDATKYFSDFERDSRRLERKVRWSSSKKVEERQANLDTRKSMFDKGLSNFSEKAIDDAYTKKYKTSGARTVSRIMTMAGGVSMFKNAGKIKESNLYKESYEKATFYNKPRYESATVLGETTIKGLGIAITAAGAARSLRSISGRKKKEKAMAIKRSTAHRG